MLDRRLNPFPSSLFIKRKEKYLFIRTMLLIYKQHQRDTRTIGSPTRLINSILDMDSADKENGNGKPGSEDAGIRM